MLRSTESTESTAQLFRRLAGLRRNWEFGWEPLWWQAVWWLTAGAGAVNGGLVVAIGGKHTATVW